MEQRGARRATRPGDTTPACADRPFERATPTPSATGRRLNSVGARAGFSGVGLSARRAQASDEDSITSAANRREGDLTVKVDVR